MSSLLVLRTLDGETVAVFSKSGDYVAFPGFERLASQGLRSISNRGMEVSWEDFVVRKEEGFNHRFLWTAVTGPEDDLIGVLTRMRK